MRDEIVRAITGDGLIQAAAVTGRNIVERARNIMNEVCHTAELRGFPLPAEIVNNQMQSTAAMGDFIPSSAVDYLRGRPVEYDAIWGSTLERAHEAGARVPHWEQLAADIRTRLQRA